MKNSRHPQVGDMVVRKFVPTAKFVNHELMEAENFIGLVREIHLDRWGHARNVLIEWTTDTPPDYHYKHGYCGTNIHNIRNEFDVIRDGIYIQ